MPFKPGHKGLGGGRKKGTATLKTRQIADQALKQGISPLEVMLNNMRFAVDAASNAATMVSTLSDRQERLIVMNEMRTYQQRAQEAAKDAAPYCHPRLASVEHGSDAKKPLRMIVSWEGEDDPVPEDRPKTGSDR